MSLLAHWLNNNKIWQLTGINKKHRLPSREPHPRPKGAPAPQIGEGVASGQKNDLVCPNTVPSPTWGGLGWGSLFALLLLLTGCTSVRPIVKIGLIAPFEGLYRESGYAALDAMRLAMAECTPSGVDVLPLALDDSGDPAQAQRAAQKLLADPTVQAIVGPLLLDAVPAVSTVITSTSTIPWYIPALVQAQPRFADAEVDEWLTEQVDTIGANSSATRVLLMGLPAEWSLPERTTIPVLRMDALADALASVAEGDALLWLGRPDVGARWLAALRVQQPNVDFWLAEQAGLDIFVAHALAESTSEVALEPDNLKAIQQFVWTDVQYNQWLQSEDSDLQPSDGTRYLVYNATCAALAALVQAPPGTRTEPEDAWQLQSRPIARPDPE